MLKQRNVSIILKRTYKKILWRRNEVLDADNKSLLDEAKKEMLFSPSVILKIKLIIFKTT